MWVVRTFQRRKTTGLFNDSMDCSDAIFDTETEAREYRSKLKVYSEIFELNRL